MKKFWTVMNSGEGPGVCRQLARGETPWKWIVLYRYPNKWNYRRGFHWIVFPYEKTLNFNTKKTHWCLNIRWYPGRLSSYPNVTQDFDALRKMTGAKA